MLQSQVEQLRIQHQQLQRLRQLETGENGEIPLSADAAKAVLATSKRKRKYGFCRSILLCNFYPLESFNSVELLRVLQNRRMV